MPAKRFAPRPESVMVGFLNYSIEWLDDVEWGAANEDDAAGGSSRHTQASIRIRISGNHAEQNLRETLIHETWHCILANTSVNELLEKYTPASENVEEVLVMQTAPMWLFVLQQNPVFAAYVQDTREH